MWHYPTEDPYLGWLLLVGTWVVILLAARVLWRWCWHLIHGQKPSDRPAAYREEIIKAKLAEGEYTRPEITHTGRPGWSRLDTIRQTRPQPRIGGSAGWGDGINAAQRQKEGKASGRR